MYSEKELKELVDEQNNLILKATEYIVYLEARLTQCKDLLWDIRSNSSAGYDINTNEITQLLKELEERE
jgi:hypothetical protein